MEALYSQAEKDNKRTSAIVTGIVTAILLILLFIPFFKFVENENISGIMINLGSFDAESFGPEEGAAAAAEEAEESEESDTETSEAAESSSDDASSESSSSSPKEVQTSDEEDNPPASNEADEKAKAEAKKKADAKKKAEDAKKKAEEEKKRKEKELADKKKELSDLLGGGGGDDASTSGDEDGEPDKSNMEGIATGTGDIGDGLGGRDVVSRPSITDNSQATGKVVVKVCVNSKGDVISAKYTQKGSTATDQGLIKTAEKGVKAYKFSPGTLDKQCGTITVNFKVQ